jgi:L-alanine-DL-glutamate epimerase-like enolase superfamily enzyme
MPQIKDIRVTTARVPLDAPTWFSTRRVLHRDYVLVRLTGDDGAEGIGFCYGGSRAGDLVRHAVAELFGPRLLREESFRVEGLWEELYQEGLLQGRTGSAMRALSILDIALWDLNARAAKLPLADLLGRAARNGVPAYASGGYYLEGKTPQRLAEECAGYVRAGFGAVKIKVGRPGVREEEARIRSVREAIGPDVLLMLDANNAWSDLPTALRYMRIYERYDPYWIEEPFSPDDIDNHARLARATPVPVATGEIEAGRWRFKELIAKDAAQVLQVDAAVCGGITEWRRIAATASSFGLMLAPHWFHDLHVHLVAATPNARWVEFFPDDQVLNFRKLIDRQLEWRDGMLKVPTAPGLGFAFDEASVARYALPGVGSRDGAWQLVRS